MNILFPTDFSEESAKSFEFALNIAKKLNLSITLIHVYPLPMTFPSMDEGRFNDMSENMMQITETALEERLKLFKDTLRDKYSNNYPEMISVSGMLKMGFVGEEVARAAKEIDAAFVVLCVKGAKKLKRFLGGNDVASIIRKCDQPIITVPENYDIKEVRNFAYATDLTFNDNSVISRVIELAANFEDSHIKCFHVHDSNLDVENAIIDDFIEQYKSEANRRLISFELIDNVNIIDGIDYFIQSRDIDLLVVLKQKKYWLEVFESSMTKKLVFHENVPMLIYHE